MRSQVNNNQGFPSLVVSVTFSVSIGPSALKHSQHKGTWSLKKTMGWRDREESLSPVCVNPVEESQSAVIGDSTLHRVYWNCSCRNECQPPFSSNLEISQYRNMENHYRLLQILLLLQLNLPSRVMPIWLFPFFFNLKLNFHRSPSCSRKD